MQSNILTLLVLFKQLTLNELVIQYLGGSCAKPASQICSVIIGCYNLYVFNR